MNRKILFFSTLLAAGLFSACAKVNYDSNRVIAPQAQGQQQAIEPQQDAKQKIAPTPAVSNKPTVKFVQNAVEMNTKLEAELEVELSATSALPVVVNVKLVNGSALHHRDFAGYKTSSPNNETSYSLIFAPGVTRIKLPKIGGRNTFYCDTEFTAEIDVLNVQNAIVSKGTNVAKISIPCNVMD